MAYIKLTESHNFSFPVALLNHIDIELTERCNNACIHCYINQSEDNQDIISREVDTRFFKEVLKQAADLGCMSVRFTGGEPLLRNDFVDLYLYARYLGMKVILFTNATLISTDLCKLFKRIPPGKPISVTVYGMHANSYDAVAGKRGAFEQFWQGINLLKEYDIPFTVKQSLLPKNRHEINEFETFAASITSMDDQPPGYSMSFDLRARRDNPAKNRFIRSLRLSPQEILSIVTRNPNKYIRDMQRLAENFLAPPGDLLFTCNAGQGSTCIDAFGIAQMCMLLRHPDTVYSLKPSLDKDRHTNTDYSALEYALIVFFPKIRQKRANNPAYLKRCAVCFLRGICEQCPAKSWEEHGTLDTPVEYLCDIAHTKAIYLGLLQKDKHSWELSPDECQHRLDNFTNFPIRKEI